MEVFGKSEMLCKSIYTLVRPVPGDNTGSARSEFLAGYLLRYMDAIFF